LRSDERSGAVFAVLLLLWGTLVAEPLHIYTHYFRKIVTHVTGLLGADNNSVWVSLVIVIVMTAAGCLLIKITETHFAPYLASVLTVLITVGYIINSIIDKDMSVICMAALGSYLAVIAIMHLAHKDDLLVWISDMYVFSHAVYVICNMMCIPLSRLGDTMSKILYITNYKDTDLAAPFDGLFSLPGSVWGSFIAVIAVIPFVYFALTRRKA